MENLTTTTEYPDQLTIRQAAEYLSEAAGTPRTVNAVRKLLQQSPAFARSRVAGAEGDPVRLHRHVIDAWLADTAPPERPQRANTCPYCGARPGQACRSATDTPLNDLSVHYARVNACPTCHAPPGEPCTGLGRTFTDASTAMHPTRTPKGHADAEATAASRVNACPYCGAAEGDPCVTETRIALAFYSTHHARLNDCPTCGAHAGRACKPGNPGEAFTTQTGKLMHAERTRRDASTNPLRARACPTCGAAPGKACRTSTGTRLSDSFIHAARRLGDA